MIIILSGWMDGRLVSIETEFFLFMGVIVGVGSASLVGDDVRLDFENAGCSALEEE